MAAQQGTKIKDHRVLSLDIGSRFIKVAELRMARGNISLLNVVVCPTPSDTVDKSQILDPDGLGKEIRRLLKENKITTRKVVSAVRSQSSVVVRPIEVARMTKKELAEQMKSEVEHHVPFSADEIVMDYAPLVDPDELPETEESMKVLLAVAQEELINAYLKVLQVAGLTPVALDVEILATIRSLVDIYKDEGAYEHTVALVNMGASSTDISILVNGNLSFNRSVPIAGDALTNAIVEQLGRTFEEAEELKKEHGQVFLETAIGELPVPQEGEAANADAAVPTDSPFFAFGDSDESMDATLAWDANSNSTPLPQQIFSLEDDVDSSKTPFVFGEGENTTPSVDPQDATQLLSNPIPSSPGSETAPANAVADTEESSPVFRFNDAEEDEQGNSPVFSFDQDETPNNGGAVFDLSSELEQQMPPPLSRPSSKVETNDDDSSAPFMFTPEKAATGQEVEEFTYAGNATPTENAGAEKADLQTNDSVESHQNDDLLQGMSQEDGQPAEIPQPTKSPQNDIFQRRIFESMQPTLTELVTEIRRSLEFFSTREPDNPVERILIYGGTSRLPKFAEFIHQEIGLEVVHADPLQALDATACRLPAEYIKDLAPVLPVCIGLGLRDMLA